ncbi:hypothetical protein QCA50_002132 [Cerrena zonata]|uniref:Uncharacterized protein n=1 Tax=Cerrena zonata TaxID=2478898 RepID=A0AAW0GYS4_9APHY
MTMFIIPPGSFTTGSGTTLTPTRISSTGSIEVAGRISRFRNALVSSLRRR